MADYQNVEYAGGFSDTMGGVSNVIMGKRARDREQRILDEKNKLAQTAWMGDPAALQELTALDPELARKTEQQAQQRVDRTTQLAIDKDTRFKEDLETVMAQIAAFEDFESAAGYGQRMTDKLLQKYPDRFTEEGFPQQFNEAAFEQIKTIGGGTSAPVGVAFRGIDPKTKQPVMYQQHKLKNGRTITSKLKDEGGLDITPAEYDAQTAYDMAASKKTGAMEAEIDLQDEMVLAKLSAESKAKLLPAQLAAYDTVGTITALKNHPGLSSVVGIGWLNPLKYAPGSQAKNFMVLAEQAKGKVFAEAYNTLKGGGPITEYESAQAKIAIARMDESQSVEEYVRALDEFERHVRDGYALLLRQAEGDFKAGPLTENPAEAPKKDVTADALRGAGGSHANPITVAPGAPKPPAGTWVKLPNGKTIQVK